MHNSTFASFLATAVFCVSPLSASQIFVTTANATTSGGAVSAQATFTAGAGTLSVVLQDNLVNPTDVAQLLSDLDFTLSVGGTSTLASSNSSELFVATGGTITLGASNVSTGWMLQSISTSPDRLTLCDLCSGGAGPSHLIIGPPGGATYSNANSSISNNKPHNPFLNQSATFVISNSSLTANSLVSNVVFSFGTTAGIDVNGIPLQSDVSGVPEPGTFGPVAALLIAAAGLLRKRYANKSRRSECA